jgi:uncharacterized protein (DUF1330 family)
MPSSRNIEPKFPRWFESTVGYLARGGLLVLEGEWNPTRLVILRFPDLAAVRNLFNDPEYQPLKALRHQVTECEIVAVEGI